MRRELPVAAASASGDRRNRENRERRLSERARRPCFKENACTIRKKPEKERKLHKRQAASASGDRRNRENRERSERGDHVSRRTRRRYEKSLKKERKPHKRQAASASGDRRNRENRERSERGDHVSRRTRARYEKNLKKRENCTRDKRQAPRETAETGRIGSDACRSERGDHVSRRKGRNVRAGHGAAKEKGLPKAVLFLSLSILTQIKNPA